MWPIILSGCALAIATIALLVGGAGLFIALDNRRLVAELDISGDPETAAQKNPEELWRKRVL